MNNIYNIMKKIINELRHKLNILKEIKEADIIYI